MQSVGYPAQAVWQLRAPRKPRVIRISLSFTAVHASLRQCKFAYVKNRHSENKAGYVG